MPECGDTAVTVRLAKADDGQRCAEIFLASRRAAFHWQPAGSFVLEDYQRAIEDEEVWVAEIDGVCRSDSRRSTDRRTSSTICLSIPAGNTVVSGPSCWSAPALICSARPA